MYQGNKLTLLIFQNSLRILGSVLINDRIALVVVALTDQPAENLRTIVRFSDTAFSGFAIEGCNIVLRDRTPMDITITLPCPTFDPSEESLYSRTVTANKIAIARRFIVNKVAISIFHEVEIGRAHV